MEEKNLSDARLKLSTMQKSGRTFIFLYPDARWLLLNMGTMVCGQHVDRDCYTQGRGLTAAIASVRDPEKWLIPAAACGTGSVRVCARPHGRAASPSCTGPRRERVWGLPLAWARDARPSPAPLAVKTRGRFLFQKPNVSISSN